MIASHCWRSQISWISFAIAIIAPIQQSMSITIVGVRKKFSMELPQGNLSILFIAGLLMKWFLRTQQWMCRDVHIR
jgi:hypothetical protein